MVRRYEFAAHFFKHFEECFFVLRRYFFQCELAGFFAARFARGSDADADAGKLIRFQIINDRLDTFVASRAPRKRYFIVSHGNIAVVMDNDQVFRFCVELLKRLTDRFSRIIHVGQWPYQNEIAFMRLSVLAR